MQQVVKILPNRALYRENLALYAAFSGDGAMAEQESQKAMGQSPWALQSLALAQPVQNQIPQATQTYQQMAKSEQLGPSYTASGLGDLAMYQAGSPTPQRFSTRARSPTSPRKRRIAPPRSLPAWPTRNCSADGSRRRSPPPRKRWRTARRGRSLPGGARPGRSRCSPARQTDRGHARHRAPAEPQAYAKIIDGMLA